MGSFASSSNPGFSSPFAISVCVPIRINFDGQTNSPSLPKGLGKLSRILPTVKRSCSVLGFLSKLFKKKKRNGSLISNLIVLPVYLSRGGRSDI